MELFRTLGEMGHEEVVFFHDQDSGLKAIIAIHNTVLGPALGGLRMWPYASDEEALTDVLRLSRGMTYKAAVSGLNLGGGKSVLIGDPEQDKSEAAFRALGRFIDGLGGRYITAEDVNTSVDDMEFVLMETDYVVGVPEVHGGGGDPSPFTAYGTLRGIEACLMRKFGDSDISKLSFAVQGVGHVGAHLVRMLRDRGGKVLVTDINQDRVQAMVDEHGAEAVPMDDIYDAEVDVYAPCALGATINEDTLPRLKCSIVAGAANNQLETFEYGTALEERGIIYAPDYAINAGGLMNVAVELQGYDGQRAERMVSGVYDNILNIFRVAERDSIPSWQAADRLAEERIAAVGRVKSRFNRGQKSMLGDRGLNF